MWKKWLIIGVLLCCGVFYCAGGADSDAGPSDYEAYVVQQGDTVTSIATQYNIQPIVIAQSNKINVNAPLLPGAVLIIPNVPQATQLPPQVTNNGSAAVATTPNGNQVEGIVGIVTAAKTQISSQPNGGILLYRNAVRDTRLLITGQIGTFYTVLMSDGTTGYVPKQGIVVTEERMVVDKPTPPPMPAQPAGRQDIVDCSMQYLGIPYKYGGSLPNNVDCSLLVQTVFQRLGMKLPRTAADQYGIGTPVDVWQLQAGDRVYFYDRSGDIGHTGIFIGGGRFIHASSNRGQVAIDELSNPTYWRIYAGARR